MRGARPHDDRIVIVGIDEQTLQRNRLISSSRKNYATLVNNSNAGGARVIAFDVTFPTPESNSGDDALQKLQAELGVVGVACLAKQIQDLELPAIRTQRLLPP